MSGDHGGDALGEDDGPVFIDFESLGVLSRDAFQLHGHGVLNSIADGQPGFVSDEYLNATAAGTTIAAAELEAAGLWERRPGGYFVVADEMVKIAINYNEEMDRLQAECTQRGRHAPWADAESESRWVICEHCSIPLRRPDGEPVALPNGGPLGRDPRVSG